MQLTAGPPPPGMAAGDPLWAANRTIAGVEWNIREGACNPPSSGYSLGSGLVLRTFFWGLRLQTTLTLCLTQTPEFNTFKGGWAGSLRKELLEGGRGRPRK